MRKILLPAGLIALGLAAVLWLRRLPDRAEAEPAATKPEAAPEFARGTKWLQSKPLTLAALRGKVVVVHFWTFGCVNCIHNYPAYKAWQQKYARKGVTIIGIHTPEFKHEADLKKILAQAKKNGLKFPIAVDNDGRNWKNWKNRYWPSIYLIDKKGRVRYRWEGELGSEKTKGHRVLRKRIEELLAEKG
jgi:thiol-disulfide isomerase/thioredoxin